MKFIKALLFICMATLSSQLLSQKVIQIKENTVFEETLIITENTIFEGVYFPLVEFKGTPKFIIKDCRVLIKTMRVNDKHNWGTVEGTGMLEWYGIGMQGSIQSGTHLHNTYLDGKIKD